MNTVTIKGELRQPDGKKGTKILRKKNLVPCVIYGGPSNVHLAIDGRTLDKVLANKSFQKIELQVEGRSYSTFLKATQFHPVTDNVLHADFQELVPGQKVTTELPVKLQGLAKGVRIGGKLMTKVRKLRVKAYPENLVPEIVVNVEELELGKSVRVQDVKIDGVEFMNSPAIPIASVEITRALRSAAAAAEKGA